MAKSIRETILGAGLGGDMGKGIESQRPAQPTSLEVFYWPEFQAFAKRLGISLEQPMFMLQITLPHANAPVQVVHGFEALDASKQTNAPPSGEPLVPMPPPGSVQRPEFEAKETAEENSPEKQTDA